MSTYYEFYAAVNRGDKVEAIGPYIRKENGEYRLEPIFIRNRSFIHWNEFAAWELDVNRITDEQLDFFTTDSWTGESRYSLAYFIPYKEICSMADDGLVRGYVTLEELDYVTKNNYHPDCLWDLTVMTSESIAEIDPYDRRKYGHIAFIDHNSTGYICSHLINAVDPIYYDTDEDKLGFIVRVC